MNAGTTLSGTESNSFAVLGDRQINYFVDGALGDDSNIGTVDSPFKTIQRAINASDESVNPGANHIFVNPGNYYEELFIYDQDPLSIDGLGGTPWDVVINSMGTKSSAMSTIGIYGSTEVKISDVWVTGPKVGISANNVHNLRLDRVMSAYNSMEGLRVYSANDVSLYDSGFMGNGYEGFRGGYINDLKSQSTYFNDNQYSGVDLYGVEHAQFQNSGAMRNGQGEQPSMGVNGIDLHNVESLHVIASSFNNNFGDGFKGLNITEAKFDGVNAGYNGWNGVKVLRTSHLESFGGNYMSNGSSGFYVADPFFEAYGEYPDPTHLNVYGGQFSSNGAFGLISNLIDKVRIEGIDARSNYYNGVKVANAYSFDSFGGYFYGNLRSGINSSYTDQTYISGGVSRFNGLSGLTIHHGSSVEVIGTAFLENYHSGIYVGGKNTDYIHNVSVTNVSALHNYYGLKGVNLSNIAVTNGNYSHNLAHGLELTNFAQSNFMYVKATDNYYIGVRLNIGRFSTIEGQQNYNSATFVGGDYNHNGMDGITVSSYFDRSAYSNVFEFHGSYLSADHNGWNGLNFMDDRMGDDREGEGEGEGEGEQSFEGYNPNYVSIYLMHSGFVGNNIDGIFIHGENQNPYSIALIASFDSVYSNDNGRYGLRADSHLALNTYGQDFAPEANSWFSAYNCEFLRNGSDGAMLNFSGVLPGTESMHFASFSEIDAHDNNGNGMTIYALIDWEQATTVSLDSKVLVENSRFNNNVLNGLQIRAGSTANESRSDSLETHEVDFEINNVTAVVNDQSGLNFGGFGSKEYGYYNFPNVAINGGHYNDNHVDGIFMEYVNYALINQTNIISNDDDGLQLDYVSDADYSTAFIVANGDNDVEINY